MVDTLKKKFVIPMAPYQPIDAGVQARAGFMNTGQPQYQPTVSQTNPYGTHTVGEINAAQGLVALQKKGGRSRRNRRRRSRKSRHK